MGHYSQGTIKNYLSELRFLFTYYCDVHPEDYTQEMVMQYLLYLGRTLGCSRDKCRMAAQSISFFFRHVLKRSYVIPSVIYPRQSTRLPAVMSAMEMKTLIDSIKNVKHRTVVMLLYSTGMRISEISSLKIADIDGKNLRVKVVQGKGLKDRYTILSEQVLHELRVYYIMHRPVEYLFNGSKPGSRLSVRTIQHVVQNALIRIGLGNKKYTVHTIRHSFATHLVDNGTDLHTVKELLGHNALQTTMRYLHLSTSRIQGVVNPYDALPSDNDHQNGTSFNK